MRRFLRVIRGPAIVVLVAFVWALFVLYPDPRTLWRSIEHVRHPVVDPAAVQTLAATMPNDPRIIEQRVLTQVMPYAYDWQTAGVPWYFPTTREALAQGRGDCESRAVVLASILAAKHIPYQIRMSFDHIWVDYPGKQANAIENNGVVLAERSYGHYIWRWPTNIDWGAEWSAQVANYWTPMPVLRRVLLLGGLSAIVLAWPLWRLSPAIRRRFAVRGGVSVGDGVAARES